MSGQITSKHFGTTPDGTEVMQFTMTNANGMEVTAINYGCTITSLKVPDRSGRPGDIVLGYEHLDGYLACTESIGCVVGRYANRIAFGKFSLDGKDFQLPCNLPPHHLHGGQHGWGRKIWKAAMAANDHATSISFSLISPDGDEGFPGKIDVTAEYILDHDNSLSFIYRAISDQKTIINLTQHTYFNLQEGKKDILGHELMIPSAAILEVDKEMIPTGHVLSVKHTPFDFLNPKKIGRDIQVPHEQLAFGNGYDHCWILENKNGKEHHAATLYDPESGRKMEVWTTEPGMQVYTANYLKSMHSGKNGMTLLPHLGVCLETQHFPDTPNHPDFPSTVLNAGEVFVSKTVLRFSND